MMVGKFKTTSTEKRRKEYETKRHPNTRTEINKAYVARGRKYREKTGSKNMTFNKREGRKGEKYK
jgi:hypothetical protein